MKARVTKKKKTILRIPSRQLLLYSALKRATVNVLCTLIACTVAKGDKAPFYNTSCLLCYANDMVIYARGVISIKQSDWYLEITLNAF